MAITFNPDTGIVVEDTATIRARLVAMAESFCR